jgi:hypothetical protein
VGHVAQQNRMDNMDFKTLSSLQIKRLVIQGNHSKYGYEVRACFSTICEGQKNINKKHCRCLFFS